MKLNVAFVTKLQWNSHFEKLIWGTFRVILSCFCKIRLCKKKKKRLCNVVFASLTQLGSCSSENTLKFL